MIDLTLVQSTKIPQTPVNFILEKSNLANNDLSLGDVLNCAAPSDNEVLRSDVSNSMLPNMLYSRENSRASTTHDSQESENQIFRYFTHRLSEISAYLKSTELPRALKAGMSRVSALKEKSNSQVENL